MCPVLSVHSGELPEERDEQRRFLHDSEEPAGRSEPVQTGTRPHLHPSLSSLSCFSLSADGGLEMIPSSFNPSACSYTEDTPPIFTPAQVEYTVDNEAP